MWLSSMHRDPGSLQSEEGNSDAQKEEERQFLQVTMKYFFPLFLTQLKYPLPGPGGQGTAKARAFPLGYSPSCYHLYDPGATNL